jgi:predicted nucleotidyltransferase
MSRTDLREVLHEYPVTLAILFGSHARGDTHSHSDIDIAVEFHDLRPGDPGYNDTLLGLSADLSTALARVDIDVGDIHSIPLSFTQSIVDSGELLTGSEEDLERLRSTLVDDSDNGSARERLDTALDRIDDALS